MELYGNGCSVCYHKIAPTELKSGCGELYVTIRLLLRSWKKTAIMH